MLRGRSKFNPRGFISARTAFAMACTLVFPAAPALAQEGSPPAPDRPWAPPDLGSYEAELASSHGAELGGVAIDPAKIYTLPELIDLAQRNNHETRVAWERARQAASAVGATESAYYPYLAASAGAGYEHAFLPFPEIRGGKIAGGGTLVTDVRAASVALSVKWLLIDFGQRRAEVDAAEARLMMANVGFNATHQRVVFEVTERFYALNVARERVEVARVALQAARSIEQSSEARLDQGLATEPEFLQAQQQSAQFAYQLEAASAQESVARLDLISSLGVPPTEGLKVAEMQRTPIDTFVGESLDRLVDRAFSQRPDLIAKLANLRAKEAEVRSIRAEYYPKIALTGSVGQSGLDVSVHDSKYFGGSEPTYGIGLAIEVPIFEGFLRRRKLEIAESEVRAAECELEEARDDAANEVWRAYTDFKTAIQRRESAARLLTAAESASSAVLEGYEQGLSTYTEVADTQRNVAMAQSVNYETRAAIYAHAAALALSVGDLARPPGQRGQGAKGQYVPVVMDEPLPIVKARAKSDSPPQRSQPERRKRKFGVRGKRR